MHPTQVKLLQVSQKFDLSKLKLREIGEKIGLRHPQLIKHHLSQLVEKGLLNKDYTPRTASRPAAIKTISIPVYGSANCGQPTLLAEESLEGYLTISPQLVNHKNPSDLFALKAKGDSMNRARSPIEDGDYLVIDKSKFSPSNGEIVVSIINGAANIKKFHQDEQTGYIYLISESKNDYPPIIIDGSIDFMINGTVVKVIKNPHD